MLRASGVGLGGLFQSTPPVRGATQGHRGRQRHIAISIHAPRAGGDLLSLFSSFRRLKFQSTPPVRGATPLKNSKECNEMISIHAPRAGGDQLVEKVCLPADFFM